MSIAGLMPLLSVTHFVFTKEVIIIIIMFIIYASIILLYFTMFLDSLYPEKPPV